MKSQFVGMMDAFAGEIDTDIDAAVAKLDIQATYHGIKNGWFVWPYNFDPVWLNKCLGFVEKEIKSDDA